MTRHTVSSVLEEASGILSALDVADSGIVEDGLLCGEGANEGLGFICEYALVVGTTSLVLVASASCGRLASAMGALKTSGIQGIGPSSE